MRTTSRIFILPALALLLSQVVAEPNPAYVCSFCVLGLGLVEESLFQIHLEDALLAKCGAYDSMCQFAVKHLILSLEAKAVPEALCEEMQLCPLVPNSCQLFATWPVDPLPEPPPTWPTERRKLSSQRARPSQAVEGFDPLSTPRDLLPLAPLFRDFLLPFLPASWGPWAHVSLALAELSRFLSPAEQRGKEGEGLTNEPACGFNFTCKLEHLAQHKPLQDFDGDYYSTPFVRRLRGNDWRGFDCDDLRGDVYPGRRVHTDDEAGRLVDYNCNGIFGGNATGAFEDVFCSNSQPRGLVILGDSATAHFHIPPQWVTARGWNMNQLLPDAENELDFPHCSWGTGHSPAEECPYQFPVPDLPQGGVVSLYTQLRARNRCNHNDFQNIGVNGARMTSSLQLVEAMARDPAHDHPLLVYLSLIGNDICNGHPDFTHMTTPDEFYAHAMETLQKLDGVLPPGSHVVGVALFDGELLYETMHAQTHPIGTPYSQVYSFMNCLEENPCWGWLNTNETVRRISTAWSNQLNRVYAQIEQEQSFANFQFIFFSPKWTDIFKGYLTTGRPLTDLIEATDGFHPSQTGNALFALHFFSFLEQEHPEALGPVNPFNDQIDALFFKQG